jgi:hypothetical protein
MFKQKLFVSLVAVFMALLISHLPQVASAQVAEQMIATSEVVKELTRAQAEQNVRAKIEKAEVKSKLEALGISTEEVTKRLATLSDAELRDLSKQMDQAKYGGAVEGILVVVLLVLLIIYLAKRV